MALLNNPKNNKKPSAKDIKIDDDVKISYGDKAYKARDRKPVPAHVAYPPARGARLARGILGA